MSILIDASYEGTDGNGNVIKKGDMVEILDNEQIVKMLLGKMWTDRLRRMLGKVGRIEYFDGDGDVWVNVAGGGCACFSTKAIILSSAGKNMYRFRYVRYE